MSEETEALTLERMQWVHQLQAALTQCGYNVEQAEISGQALTLKLSRDDMPQWKPQVAVQVIGGKNRVSIPGRFESGDLSIRTVGRVIKTLTETYRVTKSLADRRDEQARFDKQFLEQKQRDLCEARVPEWVNVNIRTLGDNAGKYRVDIQPGSPMEFLTAEQVKQLLAVLVTFSS